MNEKAIKKTARVMAVEIFGVVENLLHGWERQAAYDEFLRICTEQLEQIKPTTIIRNPEPSRN